jgi:cytochrome c biogenesis factor
VANDHGNQVIGELGQLSLCFALALSLVMANAGIVGAQEANGTARRIASGAAMGFFVFIALAFGVLTFVQRQERKAVPAEHLQRR